MALPLCSSFSHLFLNVYGGVRPKCRLGSCLRSVHIKITSFLKGEQFHKLLEKCIYCFESGNSVIESMTKHLRLAQLL